MPKVHREGDSRFCGSTTVVEGQSTVYVNGQLWAVAGDQSSHGLGALIPQNSGIYVEGAAVIVQGDEATLDDLLHIPPMPYPSTFSADTYAYGTGMISAPTDFPTFAEAAAEAKAYWTTANPDVAATINVESQVETANSPYWFGFPEL
jgi:hypothetical protein